MDDNINSFPMRSNCANKTGLFASCHFRFPLKFNFPAQSDPLLYTKNVNGSIFCS